MSLNRLVIIGVGLIGGSVARAVRLRHPDCEVIGVGPAEDSVDAMHRAGVVHLGTTDLSGAFDADLVLLATPVGVAESVLDRLVGCPVLITDVLSTKRSIVKAAADRKLRFVGSHPMTGSDKRGVEHSRAEFLDRAVCLITPTTTSHPDDIIRVEEFWTSLGMQTKRLSPDEHDRLVATASHVPHAVAAALVAIQSTESFAVGAGGLRDTTRIAGGDPDLWRDILLDNRDRVSDELKRLRGEIDQLITRLDRGEETAVRDWLAAAAAKRAAVYDR